MKRLYVRDRDEWRKWLSGHHGVSDGVWLVFYKKGSGRSSVGYEAAVEEALCFGWIDSIIKRIDDARYVRKFTPRKDASVWSQLNKRRAEKMIKAGRMTERGLLKIAAAKKNGEWSKDRRRTPLEMPAEFAEALGRNNKARENFEKLAASYRRHYMGWIGAAKRPETKKKRITEAIALLKEGERLGLK